jgi:site-specific recombinase XerD
MSQPMTAPLPEPGKPKLLDQVRQRCRVRHMALATERAYVAWIRRYILFHHKQHPLDMGAPQVSAFLTHLAVDGHVAASTQNQALSALLFLYREVLEKDFGWLDDVVRANKPKRLPVVFSPEETMTIIGELSGVRWLMGLQLYGGGLRLNECLGQRVKDLHARAQVERFCGEEPRGSVFGGTDAASGSQRIDWRGRETWPTTMTWPTKLTKSSGSTCTARTTPS